MEKSSIFNLGGNVCYIDEDAVKVLQDYLQRLREHFGDTPATDEVMNDIEVRLWELFNERRRYGMQSATLADVNEAIAILGKVEDFGEIADENTDAEQEEKDKENAAAENEQTNNAEERQPILKRKLYRDKLNAVFGGVAAGIAAFFGINAIWVRLLFILFFLCYGGGILLYLIMWLVVPKARTTAQQLEMQGIAPTAENIHRYVTEQGSVRQPNKGANGCLITAIVVCIIWLGIVIICITTLLAYR